MEKVLDHYSEKDLAGNVIETFYKIKFFNYEVIIFENINKPTNITHREDICYPSNNVEGAILKICEYYTDIKASPSKPKSKTKAPPKTSTPPEETTQTEEAHHPKTYGSPSKETVEKNQLNQNLTKNVIKKKQEEQKIQHQ